MDSEVYFHEKQRFTQLWLYVIILGVDAIQFISIYRRYQSGQDLFDGPVPKILYVLILLLVNWLIFSAKLETVVKSEGIYVKFFPFHWAYRYYKWEDIFKCYVRQYSPIAEYGGWGLRLGLLGRGRAFNVSGDKGLQLQFSNGKRLLIGTQMPDELTVALGKMGKLTD